MALHAGAQGADRIPAPPVREEVASPDGAYVFALLVKSRQATGELLQGAERKRLWSKPLPHDFRPRFALVGAGGRVVLLDDWTNVASPRAVVVLDAGGAVVAQHGFDDVAKALGVAGPDLLASARYGPWLSSRPILDPSGETARVEAGGKELTIRLLDGRLAVPERPAEGADRIPVPPVLEEQASPDGAYVFALSVKSRQATGELLQGAERKQLWSKPLPHDFRPRFALVGAGGRVVLLDEWTNVTSQRAVTVLDRDGEVVAQHAFADVAKALGVPPRDLLAKARLGPWIASPPILDPDGKTARVEAGGKELAIDLADGGLR